MSRNITFKGTTLTLVGRVLKRGDPAPDFQVTSQDLKMVRFSEFSRLENGLEGGIPQKAEKGKIKVINSFPSLDTPVCDLQVKEFNKKAVGLAAEVVIIGISKDLPFAQQRFCQANEIKNEIVLSDYRSSSFGINYGLLIKELNLLARAVIIVDKNDIIRYAQIVGELTQAVNYADVLTALKEVIENPEFSVKEESPTRCKPCEGGVGPLPKEKVDKLLAAYHGWGLVEDKKLVKELKFNDFVEAKYFLDLLSIIAQEQGHHPAIALNYNKLKITLTTHASGGLTENDFIMAKIIDGLLEGTR